MAQPSRAGCGLANPDSAVPSDMPFDRKSYDSGPSVYSDGVMAEGGDSFVVWAGGADQVVEAVRIKVTSK